MIDGLVGHEVVTAGTALGFDELASDLPYKAICTKHCDT